MAAARTILATVRAVIATRTLVDGRFRPGRVTLAEVVDASGCPRRPVLRVLDRLTRDGWLGLAEDTREYPKAGECGPKRRNPVYEVQKDIRLHRAHQIRAHITCRDKLWSTIRTLRRSTVSTLVRLTGCTEDCCRHYMAILERNGFVRQAGMDGLEKMWVLIRDTGARRPETLDPPKRRDA